jgi:hypothetical protein
MKPAKLLPNRRRKCYLMGLSELFAYLGRYWTAVNVNVTTT